MDVLEHEHDLALGAQPLDQCEEPALHFLDEDRLLTLGSTEPDGEAQSAGDPLRLTWVAAAVDDVLQPAHRFLRRHGVLDAGELTDDPGHGGERRRVAVGPRAPSEDRDVRVEPGEQLIGEP